VQEKHLVVKRKYTKAWLFSRESRNSRPAGSFLALTEFKK